MRSTAKAGIDLAQAIRNALMTVLSISGRGGSECGLPPKWRYWAMPFSIPEFLDCVNELYSGHPVGRSADQFKGSAA
jgi:hypothetical protein